LIFPSLSERQRWRRKEDVHQKTCIKAESELGLETKEDKEYLWAALSVKPQTFEEMKP
jgi:hypothetical protein